MKTTTKLFTITYAKDNEYAELVLATPEKTIIIIYKGKIAKYLAANNHKDIYSQLVTYGEKEAIYLAEYYLQKEKNRGIK